MTVSDRRLLTYPCAVRPGDKVSVCIDYEPELRVAVIITFGTTLADVYLSPEDARSLATELLRLAEEVDD